MKTSCFTSWRPLVDSLFRRSAILTEVIRGFSQSLVENVCGSISRLRHDRFLSRPLQITLIACTTIRHCASQIDQEWISVIARNSVKCQFCSVCFPKNGFMDICALCSGMKDYLFLKVGSASMSLDNWQACTRNRQTHVSIKQCITVENAPLMYAVCTAVGVLLCTGRCVVMFVRCAWYCAEGLVVLIIMAQNAFNYAAQYWFAIKATVRQQM